MERMERMERHRAEQNLAVASGITKRRGVGKCAADTPSVAQTAPERGGVWPGGFRCQVLADGLLPLADTTGRWRAGGLAALGPFLCLGFGGLAVLRPADRR